ncbi:MAG TPA: hypothetical protein VHL08_06185 [Dongiaceae bacterium]|jgi:hypothetical protein|nr:hypothetical protein [Dongiaceae bacterium]
MGISPWREVSEQRELIACVLIKKPNIQGLLSPVRHQRRGHQGFDPLPLRDRRDARNEALLALRRRFGHERKRGFAHAVCSWDLAGASNARM